MTLFGPFKVSEAHPKTLAQKSAAVSVRISPTHLVLLDADGQDIGSWPRTEVEVQVKSAYYGCLRFGKDSLWVNTGEGRPLTRIQDVLTGQVEAGQVSDAELAADANVAFGGAETVVVRAYPGRTQADAAMLFQRDAQHAARHGYVPTAQSWGEGRPGLARVAAIGIFALAVRPNGFLTVTYSKMPAAQPEESASVTPIKTCPMCAEEVKAAAKICRFCRYEFPDAAATGSP